MRSKLISLTPPGVIHIPSNNHVITPVGGETIYDGEHAIIKVIPDFLTASSHFPILLKYVFKREQFNHNVLILNLLLKSILYGYEPMCSGGVTGGCTNWEWDVWVAREGLVTCITTVERSPRAEIGNGLFSGKTEGF